MRTPLFISAAGLLVLAAGAPLAAHHSFAAEFDGSKPVTLKGTVTKMEWTNPHAWLHVDVKGPDGKVVSWMVEGGGCFARSEPRDVDNRLIRQFDRSEKWLEHSRRSHRRVIPPISQHREHTIGSSEGQ